jgi:hypothetical protein
MDFRQAGWFGNNYTDLILVGKALSMLDLPVTGSA